jgi:hypothetical protein
MRTSYRVKPSTGGILFKKALIINTRTLLFPFPQVRTVVLLPGVLLALECFLFGLIDVRKKSSPGGGNHFLILGAVENISRDFVV